MRPTTRTNQRPGRPHRLGALLLALAISLSLGACTSDNPMSPTADGDGGEPAGGNEPSLYAVEIDLSHIKIVADCDKDPIIGGPNPGEFDYTITIWGRDANDVYVKHREITGEFTKRGGQTYSLDTYEDFLPGADAGFELLTVHESLEQLAAKDARAARVAELKLFGGLTVDEIAHVVDVSARTVKSDWAFAKMWLSRALKDES